jgi:hypothetical protein
MTHHDRDSIVSNDLSARDELAVPQGVTFLNNARPDDIAIIPSVLLSSSRHVSLSRSAPEHREFGSAAASGAARDRPRSRTRAAARRLKLLNPSPRALVLLTSDTHYSMDIYQRPFQSQRSIQTAPATHPGRCGHGLRDRQKLQAAVQKRHWQLRAVR